MCSCSMLAGAELLIEDVRDNFRLSESIIPFSIHRDRRHCSSVRSNCFVASFTMSLRLISGLSRERMPSDA